MMPFGIRKDFCRIALAVLLVMPPATFSAWVNATSNLANMGSQCGNLQYMSAVPGKAKVIAGVAGVGLYATTNGGSSWTKLGTGAGSAPMDHRPSCVAYDPTNSDIFWEAGIYGSTNGVYHTTDGGVTFEALGSIHPDDNVSVDFTDPQRKVLLAPGHESPQTLHKSVDGGQTWTEIGGNLPDTSSFPHPLVIDANTYLVGCAGYRGSSGLYRSTDGGATFAAVGGTIGAQGPTCDPLVMADGSIIWSLIYNHGFIKSTDKGVTWRMVAGNGAVLTCQPIVLPDGRMAGLSPTSNKVVASTTGATWVAISDALSSTPSGVLYDATGGSFYAWYSDCGGSVLPAAIMRFDLKVSVVENRAGGSVKNLRNRGCTSIVTGLRPASLAGGSAYDLRGVSIRDLSQLRAGGVAVVRREE